MTDDYEIDQLASAMKAKMKASREKRGSGWHTASIETLSRMLREHVEKGDPIDVANFAMMIHAKGGTIV